MWPHPSGQLARGEFRDVLKVFGTSEFSFTHISYGFVNEFEGCWKLLSERALTVWMLYCLLEFEWVYFCINTEYFRGRIHVHFRNSSFIIKWVTPIVDPATPPTLGTKISRDLFSLRFLIISRAGEIFYVRLKSRVSLHFFQGKIKIKRYFIYT